VILKRSKPILKSFNYCLICKLNKYFIKYKWTSKTSKKNDIIKKKKKKKKKKKNKIKKKKKKKKENSGFNITKLK